MTRPADPRRALVRGGTFSRALTGLAQCLKWLLVSPLISVLVEWVGMVFWWEEQGLVHSRQMLVHSRQMLVNELQYLGTDPHHSGWAARPVQVARDLSDRVYGLVLSLPVFALFDWVLYLVSPVSLHPAWILLPFALAFALAVRITASTFKKYL